MVYLAGWMLNYIVTFLWSIGLRNRMIFSLTLLFIGYIISVRYSGTDTYEIYELSFRDILSGRSSALTEGWEPGFVLLTKVLLWLTSSEVWAVRGIGVVFILLLLVYLLRADRTEIKFLSLYFIPVFVYQYGMNAIRAGLGIAFILLAWQALRRGRWYQFILLGMVSLTFHYSALVPLVLLYVSELKLTGRSVLHGTLLVGLTSGYLLETRQEYFLSKTLLYLEFNSPSIFSGLSRLYLIILIWLFFAAYGLSVTTKIRSFVLVVALALGFQVLAFFSYSGLRLLDLMALVTPLVLVREYDRAGELPTKAFWMGLAVAGVLGAAFLYRNFLSDFDGKMTGTLTPFLPYRTIFDYKP